MKSRNTLIAVVLLIVVAVLCGGAIAYMYNQTEYVENDFVAPRVTCLVEEEKTDDAKQEITVKNTGNIQAYLRVRLVSNWSESDGAGGYNTIGIPSEMPAFNLGEDWIKGSDDTYYYRLPVEPNASTKDLLGSDMTLTEKQSYLQVVDVFAEAIQSLPEEAVTTSWKVTLDDDGNIATVQ